ncbi:hypothetical protein AB0K00_03430 [Dactylosporangium sp. NPDC049525]|uniref:hypothetical protein n=1 Tax=Dactylosporangium sp. NPDC049525 TaxID=3154730 RepID=UPI00341960AB
MNRIARTFAAVAFATGLATGLAACEGGQPSTAPTSTVQDKAPPAATSAAKGFPGTLSALTFERGRPILLVRGGKTIAFGTAGVGDRVPRPSSDGQHLALISSPDAGNVSPGDLVVVDAGGQRHVLAHNLPWGGGIAPTWIPDGTAVIHAGVRYAVPDGAHTTAGLPAETGYLVYSVSGTTRAYAGGEQGVTVTAADGGKRRSVDVSKFPECETACPSAVQAVSDSGDYVALGRGNTDPGHTTNTMLVVDTRTGEPVDLSAYPQLQHVWFTAAGGAVIADGKGLHVVDASWHVTGTFPAPTAGELFYSA